MDVSKLEHYYTRLTNIFNKSYKTTNIDPLTCIIKLSLLNFYPLHTKLNINNNNITFSQYSLIQGLCRYLRGDGREDLYNLYEPIIYAIEFYNKEKDTKTDLDYLFNMSAKGLKILKNSYEKNSIIQCSIDYYINLISTKNIDIKLNNQKNINPDNNNNTPIKYGLNHTELEIIINMIKMLDAKYIETNVVDNNILDSINLLLDNTTEN